MKAEVQRVLIVDDDQKEVIAKIESFDDGCVSVKIDNLFNRQELKELFDNLDQQMIIMGYE